MMIQSINKRFLKQNQKFVNKKFALKQYLKIKKNDK